MEASGSDSAAVDIKPGSPSPVLHDSEMSVAAGMFNDMRHICAVCGDSASGKHYGVHSCEGCKGFFKRTVRKELVYECHEQGSCEIDKSKRNRCQFCRYNKCLSLGMRREAVQEERQKVLTQSEMLSDRLVITTLPGLVPVSSLAASVILDAELAAEAADIEATEFADLTSDDDAVLCDAVDKHLLMLVEWARHLPPFVLLPLADQVVLLRSGWNELLISSLAFQSTATSDCIVLARGLHVYRSNAHQLNFGLIFDRILAELVFKMRELAMDRTELGCLRAIVLFNPDSPRLSCSEQVESLREDVYKSLDDYCRQTHFEDPDRFAKLMLRLPSLRSIGLKCTSHLFASRLIGDAPVESFIYDLLDNQRY